MMGKGESRMKCTSRIDPNEEELERIGRRYELLEPLAHEYLREQQRGEHVERLRQRLTPSAATTLRRQLGPEGALRNPARATRADAGKMRPWGARLVAEAQGLARQTPPGSVPR
jgi:hypothetical protein